MRASAAVVAAFVMLSGCAESDSNETQEAADLPSYLTQALGPEATALTSGEADWLVLDATAGPDSPIASFSWTLDPDAIIASADKDGQLTALLEAAPLLPANASVDAIAIQAFAETPEGLEPISGHFQPTLHFIEQTAGMPADAYTQAPPMTPLLLELGNGLVEGGQTIHFIIATTAEQAFDWGLALRTLGEGIDPSSLADDAESFLQTIEGPPLLLKAKATGSGLQMAAYLDAIKGDSRLQVTSDFVDILDRDPLPELATEARFDRALSAGLDSDGGSATLLGIFEGGAGAGEWSLSGDLHGAQLDASGQYTNLNPTPLPLPTPSEAVPLLMAQADGLGASSSTLDVNIDALGDAATLFYFQADLGTSIEELTGLPVIDANLEATGSATITPCHAQLHGAGMPTLTAWVGC